MIPLLTGSLQFISRNLLVSKWNIEEINKKKKIKKNVKIEKKKKEEQNEKRRAKRIIITFTSPSK